MANISKMGGSLTVIPDGKRLQALRKAKKLRQQQVEQSTGIPPGGITRCETGKPISIDYLQKLVNFYHCSAREITKRESVASVIDIAACIAQLFEGQLIFPGAQRQSTPATAEQFLVADPVKNSKVELAMSEQTSSAIMVLITAGSREEAVRLAEMLVNSRLAACVQILPEMESIYFWKDKVERQPETLLMAKTVAAKFDELCVEVTALHSYVTPEIIALPIINASAPYLEWLSWIVKSQPH